MLTEAVKLDPLWLCFPAFLLPHMPDRALRTLACLRVLLAELLAPAAAPRAGFALGDGAGVGKGRQIAALIKVRWHKLMQTMALALPSLATASCHTGCGETALSQEKCSLMRAAWLHAGPLAQGQHPNSVGCR